MSLDKLLENTMSQHSSQKIALVRPTKEVRFYAARIASMDRSQNGHRDGGRAHQEFRELYESFS